MSLPIPTLQQKAIDLLKSLIRVASFSKEESITATIIATYLTNEEISWIRIKNNIISKNKYYNPSLPTIVLNSHHDTVKPNKAYTKDPFDPQVENGKLYGLGSNDAGGCLVSLIASFQYFYLQESLPFNLVLLASAEEEISGKDGVELVYHDVEFLNYLNISQNNFNSFCGIVGEPTLLQMAVAEKGLMVIDGIAKGKPGHAARAEGINALYIALKDIQYIAQLTFPNISPFLGPVKTTVTVIETETKQHNVIPAHCSFVIDVRLNELYSPEFIFDYLQEHTESELNARSMRLKSTAIDQKHPLVQAGLMLSKTMYGSPTTSDKALTPFPTLKFGPGDSARSHTADEFIYLEEINDGVKNYIQLIENCKF